jgi:hypothetical protein
MLLYCCCLKGRRVGSVSLDAAMVSSQMESYETKRRAVRLAAAAAAATCCTGACDTRHGPTRARRVKQQVIILPHRSTLRNMVMPRPDAGSHRSVADTGAVRAISRQCTSTISARLLPRVHNGPAQYEATSRCARRFTYASTRRLYLVAQCREMDGASHSWSGSQWRLKSPSPDPRCAIRRPGSTRADSSVITPTRSRARATLSDSERHDGVQGAVDMAPRSEGTAVSMARCMRASRRDVPKPATYPRGFVGVITAFSSTGGKLGVSRIESVHRCVLQKFLGSYAWGVSLSSSYHLQSSHTYSYCTDDSISPPLQPYVLVTPCHLLSSHTYWCDIR